MSLITDESKNLLLSIKNNEHLTESDVSAIEVFIAGLKARR